MYDIMFTPTATTSCLFWKLSNLLHWGYICISITLRAAAECAVFWFWCKPTTTKQQSIRYICHGNNSFASTSGDMDPQQKQHNTDQQTKQSNTLHQQYNNINWQTFISMALSKQKQNKRRSIATRKTKSSSSLIWIQVRWSAVSPYLFDSVWI